MVCAPYARATSDRQPSHASILHRRPVGVGTFQLYDELGVSNVGFADRGADVGLTPMLPASRGS